MTLAEHTKTKKDLILNIKSLRRMAKCRHLCLDDKIQILRSVSSLEAIELSHAINIHSLVTQP